MGMVPNYFTVEGLYSLISVIADCACIVNNESCLSIAQGCKALKCGTKIAKCAAKCSSAVTAPDCIDCLGGKWNKCKGCFKKQARFQEEGACICNLTLHNNYYGLLYHVNQLGFLMSRCRDGS